MKKYFVLITIVALAVLILVNPFKKEASRDNKIPFAEKSTEKVAEKEEPKADMPNPASKYCEENDGKLEIVTNSDGSQFGMCKFEDYSCEEWIYFRGECDIEEDSEKIKEVLINKGLNLTNMKVVIFKHLGKYIEGGVMPISADAGGGYVFVVKDGDEVKVLAHGNGGINCSIFEEYPDYPAYLVPECVDEVGNPVAR